MPEIKGILFLLVDSPLMGNNNFTPNMNMNQSAPNMNDGRGRNPTPFMSRCSTRNNDNFAPDSRAFNSGDDSRSFMSNGSDFIDRQRAGKQQNFAHAVLCIECSFKFHTLRV